MTITVTLTGNEIEAQMCAPDGEQPDLARAVKAAFSTKHFDWAAFAQCLKDLGYTGGIVSEDSTTFQFEVWKPEAIPA